MKRPNPHTLPPDFRSREKEALIRRNKIVVYLNDKELETLERYKSMLKGGTRAGVCRDAIMEKALGALDENSPTLF